MFLPARRPGWRRRVSAHAAFIATMSTVWVLLALATAVASDESAVDGPTWTTEQAIAALERAPVAAMPGSVAVFDADALRADIGDSPIRILAVPFEPPGENLAANEEAVDTLVDPDDPLEQVERWARERDLQLISVTGLEVNLPSLFVTRPSTEPELQQVMLRSDVTELLRFAIAYTRDQTDDWVERPTAMEATVPWDEATIASVVEDLRASRYFAAPGADAPDQPFADWQRAVPDRTVRVAMFPSPAPGQSFVDRITPLAAAFPEDIVVVSAGRWVGMTGPEPEVLRSAVLYGYGAHYERIAEEGVATANVVLAMLRRVQALRTGSIDDQAGPEQDDPVGGARRWLPWVFLGVALLLGLVAFGTSRRTAVRRRTTERARRLTADRLSVEVALLARHILQLDDAVSTSATTDERRALLTRSAERYRTARNLLADHGDIAVARAAADESRRLLDELARQAEVRLVGSDVDAGPVGTDAR